MSSDAFRIDWRDWKGIYRYAQRYFDREIWKPQSASTWFERIGRRVLQIGVIVVQGVRGDQIALRASALTYFALLSLIPVLAIAFSLVEAFGVSDDLALYLVEYVTPGIPDVREKIREVLEQVDFKSLGTIGAAILLGTTIFGLSNIEHAFNTIWGVQQTRTIARRFSDYLATLVVAPLLLAVGVGSGTALQSVPWVQEILNTPGISQLYRIGLQQLPTVVVFIGFLFLYWFVPNTNVRFRSAAFGALFAAVIFRITQKLYVDFSVDSARADALYGVFATLSVFIVFLYVSWVIVLLGVEFSFAHQNLNTFRVARLGEDPDPGDREAIGVCVAAAVASEFHEGQGGRKAETMAADLDVPVRTVRNVLQDLRRAGIVANRGDPEDGVYQLGRDASGIRVTDVLAALRGPSTFEPPSSEPYLREALARLEVSMQESLATLTLAEIADRGKGDDRA